MLCHQGTFYVHKVYSPRYGFDVCHTYNDAQMEALKYVPLQDFPSSKMIDDEDVGKVRRRRQQASYVFLTAKRCYKQTEMAFTGCIRRR